MRQHVPLRFASPDGGQQRLKHDVGRLPGLYGPADDAAGEEVDHDRQIGEAFVGADIGDVGHPGFVRHLHVKPAIERLVDRQGWLASILAEAPISGNRTPRRDACVLLLNLPQFPLF